MGCSRELGGAADEKPNVVSDDKGFDVFISYSHADRAVAISLDALLSLAGLRTFLDDKDLGGGDNLVEGVFGAIDRSGSMIVLLSEASARSRWVREEYSAARVSQLAGNRIRVIPLVLTHSREEIPAALRHLKSRNGQGFLDSPERRSEVARELLRDLGVVPAAASSAETVFLLENFDSVVACLGACAVVSGYGSLGNPMPQWLGPQHANSVGKYLTETSGVKPVFDGELISLADELRAIDGRFDELHSRAIMLCSAASAWSSQGAGLERLREIYICELEGWFVATVLADVMRAAVGDVVVVLGLGQSDAPD